MLKKKKTNKPEELKVTNNVDTSSKETPNTSTDNKEYSKHYYIKDDVKINVQGLKKNYFLWKNKNIFAILLGWISSILLVGAIALGVSYSKNHELISFGYDFSQTSEIEINNYVGNPTNAAEYVDDINNHRIVDPTDPTKPAENPFIHATLQMHHDLDKYFKDNHILYYDNAATIDKTFFDPYAFTSQKAPDTFDPAKEQLFSYHISFNVGVNTEYKYKDLRKIFDLESVKVPLYKIMDEYRKYFGPLIIAQAHTHHALTPYLLPDNNKDWVDNWVKATYDTRLFYGQHGASSQSILNELAAIFITFIILTMILVVYFLIRYGVGSSLAIILAFISYGILAISALICSTLVISGTSVIMIFSGFILMVINLAILMPVYMKIRKELLMNNQKIKKELTSKEIYNISRQAIKSYRRIFLVELIMIIVPTVIYLIGNVVYSSLHNVPAWIILRYNISNEILFLMCILFANIICFIVFLPLWANLQTRSIRFWKSFHFKASTLKDLPEETSFEGINNIQNNEELHDAFQDK